MDKFSINYTQINMQNTENQQAAGFPPFTRGYHTHNFTTQIIPINLFTDQIHYHISELSVIPIIQLFDQIILQKETSPNTTAIINLKIPFTNTINDIISIRVLRTVLACICNDLYKNPNTLKFNFIAFAEDTNTITEIYNFANIAQIDTLVSNESLYNIFIKIQPLLPKFPIDCLSGGKKIEEKTALLFTKVYSKIPSL